MAIEVQHYINEFPSPFITEEVIKLDQKLMDYPWPKKDWESWFEQKRNFLLVTLHNKEEVLGFALFELEQGAWGHLLKIAIKESYRLKGLGYLLIENSLKSLKKARVKSITLEVREKNLGAIKLYQKLGFQQLSRIKGFYSDNSAALKMIYSMHY